MHRHYSANYRSVRGDRENWKSRRGSLSPIRYRPGSRRRHSLSPSRPPPSSGRMMDLEDLMGEVVESEKSFQASQGRGKDAANVKSPSGKRTPGGSSAKKHKGDHAESGVQRSLASSFSMKTTDNEVLTGDVDFTSRMRHWLQELKDPEVPPYTVTMLQQLLAPGEVLHRCVKDLARKHNDELARGMLAVTSDYNKECKRVAELEEKLAASELRVRKLELGIVDLLQHLLQGGAMSKDAADVDGLLNERNGKLHQGLWDVFERYVKQQSVTVDDLRRFKKVITIEVALQLATTLARKIKHYELDKKAGVETVLELMFEDKAEKSKFVDEGFVQKAILPLLRRLTERGDCIERCLLELWGLVYPELAETRLAATAKYKQDSQTHGGK